MKKITLLMSVVAIAMTSCERPTYRDTGDGIVFYKSIKKNGKTLVGLCRREKINGKWKETEEFFRPQYDEISQDFAGSSNFFTFSRGDSSYVGLWSGHIFLGQNRIKKGSVKYLGTKLYNGACFYPGDVYEMRRTNGRTIYWFDYNFYEYRYDRIVPGYCGYMVNIGKAWAPIRYRVVRNQANAMQYLTQLKFEEFLDVDYDSVYEVVNRENWTNFYYMAFKDGNMIVLNSEGQKVTKYPSVINKKLLKTKINNSPSWDWYGDDPGRSYPKRVGIEEAGTIFVRVPHNQWF